jgi:hypothetical protein
VEEKRRFLFKYSWMKGWGSKQSTKNQSSHLATMFARDPKSKSDTIRSETAISLATVFSTPLGTRYHPRLKADFRSTTIEKLIAIAFITPVRFHFSVK